MSLCARHARILALVLTAGISAPAFAIGVSGPEGDVLNAQPVDAYSSEDFVLEALSAIGAPDGHGSNHVWALSDSSHPDAACVNSLKLFYNPDFLSTEISEVQEVPHLEAVIKQAMADYERLEPQKAKVSVEKAGMPLPAIVLLGALGCFSAAAMPRRR